MGGGGEEKIGVDLPECTLYMRIAVLICSTLDWQNFASVSRNRVCIVPKVTTSGMQFGSCAMAIMSWI